MATYDGTSSSISHSVAGYYAAELLKRIRPMLIVSQFLAAKPIPKNKGEKVSFNRYDPLSTVENSPLVEGVTPNGQFPTLNTSTFTLQQFGSYIPITDAVQDIVEDPVMREFADIISQQAAETVEKLNFGYLLGGTNAIFSGGTTRATVDGAFTLDVLKLAVRRLRRQSAKEITRKLSSNGNFGTENVKAAFIGICHPDLEATIRAMEGFIDAKDYASMAYETELGSVYGVRFLTSTLIPTYTDDGAVVGSTGFISTGTTNIDVYPVIIFGQDAACNTPLAGASSLMPIVHNPGTSGGADPLNQRGTIGWKTWHAGGILQDQHIVRVEVGVAEITVS